mgnify:CR=1 FL=1
MDQSKIDHEHLTVTGHHRHQDSENLIIEDDTVIVVTKAFGPAGDNLVGVSDVAFDGHPAVTVTVESDGKRELVHLSPIHGDPRKKGGEHIVPGTRCTLYCPVSNEALPYVGEVEDGSGAGYFALYLSEQLSQGEMVSISNLWGHYHSRIIDDMELISYWANSQSALD